MTNAPKNQSTFNINQVGNVNTGDVTIQRDQIGIQKNYSLDPEIQATISDLKAVLIDLQAKYPHLTSETEALAIIDAEFTEIKQTKTHKLATLHKQLLNPERHFQAIKATLIEVGKHYSENNILGKAIFTYFDKFSEDLNHPA